jgi:OmpA-OmpF porin, OOP family
MSRNLFLAIFMGAAISASAQKAPETGKYKLVPNDQWEFGLHTGLVFTQADANNKVVPSYGGGAYLRKALDHVFSVRGSVNYYLTKGTSNNAPYNTFQGKAIDKFSSPIINGEIDLVIALASGRFDGGKRTINPYVFVGGGYGSEKTNLTLKGGSEVKDAAKIAGVNGKWGQAQGGAGISFRVTDKFSFGIEQKFVLPVGSFDDYLDGVIREQKDIPSYTNIRLGFNIGGGKDSKKPIPLWWANPAEQINADLADLKKRAVYDPTDTDADGVIDALDQEKDTPSGVRVDTRGAALDSDGDGLADYKDKEPFSPVGFKTDAQGVAQVPKPNYATEADVDRIVDAKIAKLQATMNTTPKGGAGVADWFLPMIHFDFNSAKVRDGEYGSLASVASVMKSNPGLSIVVTGATDKVAGDGYNQGLSYRRAESAIDALVKRFGVDRSRLILNYNGENQTLIPTSAASYMNRRVEFKVAQGEAEMAAPAGAMKKKSYKGNKSGY